MTSYVTPKKNTAFIFYVSLTSQANTKVMKASPTLAAGDVKVSIDGGALNSLATLPTNTPAASTMVKVSLSASEMNGDNITVVFSDAAGAEWCDLTANIQTSARQVDDLAYPATTGNSLAVDGSGYVTVGTMAAAAIQSIWDALTAALTTVGSIGKLLVDSITDTYQAKIEVVDDNVGAADRYIISWFKNGEPISAGVTLATIQVVKSSDGTDLIASSAMTIVAGTSNYYYSATGAERLVSGESYVAVLTATIDSAVRSWRQPVGIDS